MLHPSGNCTLAGILETPTTQLHHQGEFLSKVSSAQFINKCTSGHWVTVVTRVQSDLCVHFQDYAGTHNVCDQKLGCKVK